MGGRFTWTREEWELVRQQDDEGMARCLFTLQMYFLKYQRAIMELDDIVDVGELRDDLEAVEDMVLTHIPRSLVAMNKHIDERFEQLYNLLDFREDQLQPRFTKDRPLHLAFEYSIKID